MERIDRLQNRFDQTRVEVNAGFNNAARIEDKTTALQAELRAMVEQYKSPDPASARYGHKVAGPGGQGWAMSRDIVSDTLPPDLRTLLDQIAVRLARMDTRLDHIEADIGEIKADAKAAGQEIVSIRVELATSPPASRDCRPSGRCFRSSLAC